MTSRGAADDAWVERAADRSPMVRRSRSRSIEQTRQIVDAGGRLFQAKGTSFTIQELAKEAKVALQTFYRHFGGKDEFLLALLEQTVDASCHLYAEQAKRLPDPLSRLRFYITAAATSAGADSGRQFVTSEHYRLHQLFPEELAAANRPFTVLLVPEIEEAAAAGLLAPADVQAAAWFVTQLVMATFHHYAFVAPPKPLGDVGDDLWRFCLAALGGGPDRIAATLSDLDTSGRLGC